MLALSIGPSITVIEPHDMSTWLTGTSSNITWSTTSMPATSYVRIELYVDRAQSARYVSSITHSTPAITTVAANTGSFLWNTTLPIQYGAATWFKVTRPYNHDPLVW